MKGLLRNTVKHRALLAMALPGIVLQLAVVPSIVYYLMRAGLIPQRYPR